MKPVSAPPADSPGISEALFEVGAQRTHALLDHERSVYVVVGVLVLGALALILLPGPPGRHVAGWADLLTLGPVLPVVWMAAHQRFALRVDWDSARFAIAPLGPSAYLALFQVFAGPAVAGGVVLWFFRNNPEALQQRSAQGQLVWSLIALFGAGGFAVLIARLAFRRRRLTIDEHGIQLWTAAAPLPWAAITQISVQRDARFGGRDLRITVAGRSRPIHRRVPDATTPSGSALDAILQRFHIS